MNKVQNSYGGFLEFEAGRFGKSSYHPTALALSNGRACFNYILLKERPSHVFVPFYTCGALFDPLIINNIPYTFYAIDENLDPVGLPELIKQNELIVYINYFGIKSDTVDKLIRKYNSKLIVDNCMSFFSQQYPGCYSYNSCRKFFGVPDGAYLYSPEKPTQEFERYNRFSYAHLVTRLLGDFDKCYDQFLENERSFDCTTFSMSILSEKILNTVDYKKVSEIRRQNFLFLHKELGNNNSLNVPLDSESVPHYYPLLCDKALIRSTLSDYKLFIPVLWPDVLTRRIAGFEFEKHIVTNIFPLPVDQRYTIDDMKQIIKFLSL
jgi:hypothetical protein